jgi:cell division inhibitor SulA/protein ImuA
MGLVIPALAQLSLENRWIAWVAPPFVPYAPTLAAAGVDLSRVLVIHPRGSADSICAVEQALRSGNCGAVLGWLAGTKGVAPKSALQRLRLAAEQGHSRGILFRTAVADQAVSSPVMRFGEASRSSHTPVLQQLEIGLN